MTDNENARPRDGDRGAGGEQVGGPIASVTRLPTAVTPVTITTPPPRAGDPVVTHRRDVRALDEHLADDPAAGYTLTAADVLALAATPPAAADNAPRCGGVHTGPCDWWSTCTGMALTTPERDAAAGQHPWQAVAA
ncbi:hypothetical protein Vqi01_06420 [Micromonospora qiuiae]|uniref:Uncharacterized protein n=1 Tax=Micromonospora qiuiae TaxID=502268 RepID=A0ABQ4J5Q5_9ACTN|nr:hypothetical protein [Micromonospora qiuiae]GIJ25480.1 hypothetical protein Vqi01_06420 [Micromonospora qiuiae]